MTSKEILDLHKNLIAHYENVKLDNATVTITKSFHKIPIKEFLQIAKDLGIKPRSSFGIDGQYLVMGIGNDCTMYPGVSINLFSETVELDLAQLKQA
jgi:hypothetical protein